MFHLNFGVTVIHFFALYAIIVVRECGMNKYGLLQGILYAKDCEWVRVPRYTRGGFINS